MEEDGGYATLLSIVALLFSLADIARHAAFLPAAQRYRVLWIVRPAVAVARKIAVEEMIPGAQDISPDAPLSGNDPEDALSLAGTLQLMAWMLATLVEELAAYDANPDTTAGVAIQLPSLLPQTGPPARNAFALPCPDTS